MSLFAAPLEAYAKASVFVPPVLAKWLRPHQREGVQFCYECVMGLKEFDGAGCILADDMGLGKVRQRRRSGRGAGPPSCPSRCR